MVLFLFCISYQGYYNALVVTKLAFEEKVSLEKRRCAALFPKDLEAPKPYTIRLQEVVAA